MRTPMGIVAILATGAVAVMGCGSAPDDSASSVAPASQQAPDPQRTQDLVALTTAQAAEQAQRIALVVSGQEWLLEPGDVISFRADQRHSYANPTRQTAVGYSVVLLAPIGAR